MPIGVADEGTDEGAGAVGVRDGVVDGETGGKVEAVIFLPKSSKGEVTYRDGAALVDLDLGEGRKFIVLEVMADGVADRMVQNKAVSAIVVFVVGEKDDRFLENVVVQTRAGDEKLAFEDREGFGSHDDTLRATGCQVKARA